MASGSSARGVDHSAARRSPGLILIGATRSIWLYAHHSAVAVVCFLAPPQPDLLAKLVDLRWLQLRGAYITDVTPLVGMTKLEALGLHDTPLESIAPIAKLKMLRRLDLSESRVADLAPLAKLPALERRGETLWRRSLHAQVARSPERRSEP